jgi:hypothetical protein
MEVPVSDHFPGNNRGRSQRLALSDLRSQMLTTIGTISV